MRRRWRRSQDAIGDRISPRRQLCLPKPFAHDPKNRDDGRRDPCSIDGLVGLRRAALAATLNAPVGIAVTTDGGIYVSDTYNDRIRLIRDGIVSTVPVASVICRRHRPGVSLYPLGIAVWGDRLLIAIQEMGV